MFVVLALSKSAASFSVRTARFGGAAARLMSVKGGSIPESESDKVLYTLGLSIAREVGSPEYKSQLAYRFLLKGRSISESDSDKFLYSLGLAMARQVGAELKPQLTKEEVNTVILGFTDSKAGKVPDELDMIQKYDPKTKNFVISRKEKAKGLDFITKYLEANPTAINTASGLVYHETVPGLGAQPTADSTVEVHYHGTTLDGTVFDSSVQRGETNKFPLKSVIAGWQEGVAMMKVGGKATLVCPSEIAYGESGSPPVILPGATLVFEVELINLL